MDLVNILPALESIASAINFGPLNDLLVQIRQFVDRILLYITPDAPVRDGGQTMMGYADHFNDLTTKLGNGIADLQDAYRGPAADAYNASAAQALDLMRKMHGHLAHAVDLHGQLAEHFAEALLQQGLLIAQGAVMAADLGSLIFTAGLDAPISVPVAAVDAAAAGGSVVAMDAAVDAAEVTVEGIGASALDMGDMAFDLGEEGANTLAEGDTIFGGGTFADEGGVLPPNETPLDPSGEGGLGMGSGGPPDEGGPPPTDGTPPEGGSGENPRPPNPSDLTDTGTSSSGGGRGGTDIPPQSTPNSYQLSASGKHFWTYDENGRISWDISRLRAKQMQWNQNSAGEWFLKDGGKFDVPPEWLALFP